MITPSFGITATERVLPRLALDWTTGAPQAGVDVVRAGVATFVGSDGLIQSASANTQRVDYSSGIPALLVEEARSNLAVQSSSFGSAAWGVQQVSVNVNTLQSPDGTVNADTITQNSATAIHGLTGSIVVTSGTTYAWSIFAKANTSTILQLTFGNSSGTFSGVGYANFNLSTGVVTATGGTLVGSDIENYGNGWYRCWIAATATVSAATNNWLAIANSTTYGRLASYTGNNASGFYIFGAQVEVGARPSSYIPTEAVAVTRNADVASMTGANFSDWFNASAGTFFISANAQNAEVLLTAGSYSLSADATGVKKYATTYTADPSATELAFGLGSIQKVYYYKQALLAAELNALTA